MVILKVEKHSCRHTKR